MLIRITGQLTITDLPPRAAPAPPDELAWLVEKGRARTSQVVRNKVVDLGLSGMSRLIGFGLNTPDVTNGVQTFGVVDINDLLISAMTFGDLNAPTAPTAADFELEDPTTLTSVTPVASYPGDAVVRWQGVIPANTLTGEQVTEECLFMANGALFARTTFAAEVILAGMAKQFDHDFTITEA